MPERRKQRKKPTEFGPWARGMVNTLGDHAIPIDALVDARDCDIDREGFVASRPAFTVIDGGSGYKSLYTHPQGHFAVAYGQVGVLGALSFEALRSVAGDISWTDLNGLPTYCDSQGVYQIEGSTVTQLTLRATLTEEERYGLVPMPGGKDIGYWQGRILVLRGKSLLWSEALDYGSHSQGRNFIRFSSTPTWIAPLPSGIFVGLQDEVVFLAGTDPAKFELRVVAGLNCPTASLVVDSRHFGDFAGDEVAIWFSDVGFVVGGRDGGVVYPQAENLRGLPIVPRTIAFINDRVYAFANEE